MFRTWNYILPFLCEALQISFDFTKITSLYGLYLGETTLSIAKGNYSEKYRKWIEQHTLQKIQQ